MSSAGTGQSSLLGRTVAGKFRIEALVGGGAMGDVYRARHTVLDSLIALKIMRSDVAREEMFRERFYREAKAASRLEHPNSVRVLDFGQEPDGLVYLAMEFLSGRDLLGLLRDEWPLSDERIVDILSQTLGAVSVAHELGIVHRDLKPENIMVVESTDDDGRARDQVKVCDFGIAKLSDARAFEGGTSAERTGTGGRKLTATGTLIGTPEYMSPEQARGDSLDARSDLYSIGVILYQMLTGRVPFTGENALGVVLKQVTDEPEPPSKERPSVNAKLEQVCLRALKKKPDERYPSAKQMRAELRAAVGRGHATDADSGHLPDSESPASLAESAAEIASAPTLAGAGVEVKGRLAAEVAAPPSRGGRGLIVAVASVALVVGAASVYVAARPEGKTETTTSVKTQVARRPRGHARAKATEKAAAARTEPEEKEHPARAKRRATSEPTSSHGVALPAAGLDAGDEDDASTLSSSADAGSRPDAAAPASFAKRPGKRTKTAPSSSPATPATVPTTGPAPSGTASPAGHDEGPGASDDAEADLAGARDR